MTRNEFIRRLKAGLKGIPEADLADIVADYDAHFDAALAEGRSEAEVAEALGNPGRLARELRLEAGIRNWQSDRTPSSAWAAVLAFMGLATIDILILLPIVLPVLGVMFGLFVAVVAIFIAGGFVMIAGPFSGFPGGAFVAVFRGARADGRRCRSRSAAHAGRHLGGQRPDVVRPPSLSGHRTRHPPRRSGAGLRSHTHGQETAHRFRQWHGACRACLLRRLAGRRQDPPRPDRQRRRVRMDHRR
ncbi:DUF1700 domain-containing protein [Novosphingobium colocasiae]